MPFHGIISSIAGPAFMTAVVQTTDATKTTIRAIPTSNDSAILLTCDISGISSDGALAANGRVIASFKNDGGVLTQQNFETGDHFEFPAGWNFVIDIDSTTLDCNVTGAAGVTIDWKISIKMNTVKV